MSVLSKTSYWPLKYRLAQIFPFHLTGDKHTKKSKRFLKSNFFLLLRTVKYVIQPIKGKNKKEEITWNDLSESISPFWKIWFSFNGCLCLTFMADIVRQDDWFDKNIFVLMIGRLVCSRWTVKLFRIKLCNYIFR